MSQPPTSEHAPVPTTVDIVLLLDSLNRKAMYLNVVITLLAVLFMLMLGFVGFNLFHPGPQVVD